MTVPRSLERTFYFKDVTTSFHFRKMPKVYVQYETLLVFWTNSLEFLKILDILRENRKHEWVNKRKDKEI